jgi:hypothetical protein
MSLSQGWKISDGVPHIAVPKTPRALRAAKPCQWVVTDLQQPAANGSSNTRQGCGSRTVRNRNERVKKGDKV